MTYDAVFVYINVLNGCISGAEYQIDSAYVRSYLKKHNINTLQYINKNPDTYWNIANEIVQLKSRCFVFYINEYNYFITKTIINLLKQIDIKIQIYAIGPVVKFISENLLNDAMIDICILDGYAFALREVLIENIQMPDICNIVFRKDGKIIFSESKEVNYALDDLGLIYSNGLVPPEEVQNVGILSSIGCYGNCTFCSYNDKSNVFKIHEIDNIINELKFISTYLKGNEVKICFFDDCFSVSNERTIQLCKRIVSEGIKFKFWCCTRADLLSEELIDAMAEANFTDVVIGLETASIKIMDMLEKVKCNDNAENYINNIKKMYLYSKSKKINPFLSANFGLPNENFEDAVQTINFLKENSALNNTSVCFMTCFPGSKIFNNSETYNLIKKPSPTVLPYRTYYTNYNMRVLYENMVKEGLRNSLIPTYQIADNQTSLIELQSFFTGVNTNSNKHSSLKLIRISNYNKPEMDFIDKNIDINGKVVFFKNKLKIDNKYVFCEDRKNLRFCIEEYDENLITATSNNKYLPRQVFINTDYYPNKVIIDNIHINQAMNLYIKKLKDREALTEIVEISKRFYENNYLTVKNIRESLFENSCSFSGICSLCKLNRVTIEDNCILGCQNRGRIGSVDDTYEKLISNVNTLLKEKEEKCINCKANPWCSKCMYPPDFYGNEEFCEFIKGQPFLGIFIRLVNYINSYFNIRCNDPSELQIHAYLSIMFKDKLDNEHLAKFKDEIAVINYKNYLYILNLENGNIFQCNDSEKIIAMQLLGLDSNQEKQSYDYFKTINKFKSYELLVFN